MPVTLATYRGLLVFGALCCVHTAGVAFEAYETPPSARAMGMAGVFTPQADDGSAIWYNPAGPKSVSGVGRDVSLDVGTLVHFERGRLGSTGATLKFAGWYEDRLSPLRFLEVPIGVGIGYVHPYEASSDVNTPRSVLDPQPFGEVRAAYQQVSVLLAAPITERISLGVTGDAVWTELTCLDYSPCAGGPSGFGWSGGLAYSGLSLDGWRTKFSLQWRSEAELSYDSIQAGSLAATVQEAFPNRPNALNVGANLNRALGRGIVQVNAVYGRTAWADAASSGLGDDAQQYGLGTEWVVQAAAGALYAVRAGYMADRSGGGDLTRLAVGAGVAWNRRQFLDLAVNLVESESGGASESAMVYSASYSYQQPVGQ